MWGLASVQLRGSRRFPSNRQFWSICLGTQCSRMEGGTVFEFRSYRIRRVAAVVMIVASASAGFILGRLSVLVLPSRPPPERPKTAMSLLPPGAQEPRARAAQKHGAETDVDKGSSSKPPKPIGAPQEHHRIINSASQ